MPLRPFAGLWNHCSSLIRPFVRLGLLGSALVRKEKNNLLAQQQSPSGWRGCSLAVLMSLRPERDRSGSGESSYSGTRTPASAVDGRTARDIPPLPASHCSQLQSGTVTSEESLRANAVSTPTLVLWKGHSSSTCLGAALLPGPAGPGTSQTDAGSVHELPGLLGLQAFFVFVFFLQEKAMWKTT